MSVARGEVILTLVPPPSEPPQIQDNEAQARARRDLATALVNYRAVFHDGSRVFVSWDDLTTELRQQSIQWAYDAEYAAFLRPRVQRDVRGNVIHGE